MIGATSIAESRRPLFRGLLRRRPCSEPIEMRFDLLEMHHVDILVMKIEKIDLVDQFRTIERAFLHDRHVKAVRIGVHRAGANATRSALAADEQAANPE